MHQDSHHSHLRSARSARRAELTLTDLGQVVEQAHRLAAGHYVVGDWSLAQICTHLGATLNGSIDGFDLRRHGFKRTFLSGPLLWWTYRYGIPARYTVDPSLTPCADIDWESAFASLSAGVDRYSLHRGALQPHPLFGRLTRAASSPG